MTLLAIEYQKFTKGLVNLVDRNPNMFMPVVGMVPMNNIAGAIQILKEQILGYDKMVGIQLFTRAIGKSIVEPSFEPVFQFCSEHHIPICLHPVFDDRKSDNNIVFSW